MKYPNPTTYDKHIVTKVDKTLGYVYFLDKDHPLSDVNGKVYYHRHVLSVKIGKWMDRSYHVHHLDENKQNNDPSNLEMISPSRHQRKHGFKNGTKTKKVKICKHCSKRFITKDDSFCSQSCASKSRNKGGIDTKITKEELQKLLWEIPTTKIAEKLQCSDVMINKICKKWNINKPPRGYWSKQKIFNLSNNH